MYQRMSTWFRFLQIVAPKKAKLAAANAEFEELQAALAAKKAILKQVQEKLAELQEQLRQKGEEKAALEAEVLNCENVLIISSPSFFLYRSNYIRYNS